MRADYHHFDKEHIIFNQGDKGDKLYIILSGSVKVILKKQVFGDDPIVVATLYDGQQFGELAIFTELDKD